MAPRFPPSDPVVAMILPVRRPGHSGLSDDSDDDAGVARSKVNPVFAPMSTSPPACAFAAVVLASGLPTRRSVGVIGERVSVASDRSFRAIGAGFPRSA